jgi:hypothetical protein
VAWCRAQDYEVVVGDDMAKVDLDWWNTRLARHQIPVQLCGRDADGLPTDHGTAYLRRADLNDDTLPAQGPADLCVLYRAAAWLTGHPARSHARHFPDITRTAPNTPHRGAAPALDVITTALDQLRRAHPGEIDPGPYRSRSGWRPRTPGVGPTLLSLYVWAVHDTTTFGRPQLLDQHSVATLVYLGWLEDPSVPHFTRTRYRRYQALLNGWATHAQVPAELIEMWLTQHWRDRHTRAPSRHS